MRKEFLGRGIRFPFGFDSARGGVAFSEYEQNIRENVSIILGTKPGERQMLPTFGCRMHEVMFSPHVQASSAIVRHHVIQALARWEPRIEVQDVEAWPDDTGTIRVSVQYKIKSTADLQQLSLLLTGS